jgi:hypothetical protein
MQKIVIGFVGISVVIGCLGGYGWGYVIYQPQLQSLQNELRAVSEEFNSLSATVTEMGNVIASLNSTVEKIENRSWYEAYSIEASEDITSSTFHLMGKKVRVTWIFTSFDATAELTVYLKFANGTTYAWWGDSGTWSVDNAELELAESGDYYVSISSSELIFYYVAVHDYY